MKTYKELSQELTEGLSTVDDAIAVIDDWDREALEHFRDSGNNVKKELNNFLKLGPTELGVKTRSEYSKINKAIRILRDNPKEAQEKLFWA